MNKLLTWVVIAAVLGGCGSGKITRRHSSLTPKDVTQAPKVKLKNRHVVVSAYPAPTPTAKTPEPLVLQLSERGQRAYVELAQPDPTGAQKPIDINKHVSARFAKPAKKSTAYLGGRPEAKVRLVFSAAKNGDALLEPAGRIAGLKYTLEGISGYTFRSWNAFETKYGTVDLGTISRSATGGVSATLSPTLGGSVIGTGELSGTYSETFEEELVLRDRIVELTGTLSKNTATLSMESGIGLDLVGNTIVDLAITFPVGGGIELTTIQGDLSKIKPKDLDLRWPRVFEWPLLPTDREKLERYAANKITPLFPMNDDGSRIEAGSGNPVDDATFQTQVEQEATSLLTSLDFSLVNIVENIEAKLSAEYWYRSVPRGTGDKTIFEGDDRATLFYGTAGAKGNTTDGTSASEKATITLMDRRDQLEYASNFRLFFLQRVGEGTSDLGVPEGLLGDARGDRVIVFADYESAYKMQQWMESNNWPTTFGTPNRAFIVMDPVDVVPDFGVIFSKREDASAGNEWWIVEWQPVTSTSIAHSR